MTCASRPMELPSRSTRMTAPHHSARFTSLARPSQVAWRPRLRTRRPRSPPATRALTARRGVAGRKHARPLTCVIRADEDEKRSAPRPRRSCIVARDVPEAIRRDAAVRAGAGAHRAQTRDPCFDRLGSLALQRVHGVHGDLGGITARGPHVGDVARRIRVLPSKDESHGLGARKRERQHGVVRVRVSLRHQRSHGGETANVEPAPCDPVAAHVHPGRHVDEHPHREDEQTKGRDDQTRDVRRRVPAPSVEGRAVPKHAGQNSTKARDWAR